MKKTLTVIAVLVLTAFLSPFSATASELPQPQMFLQSESPEGFAKTVKIFKEEIKAGGWSILNTTNLPGVLSAKGYTLAPVLIFDVCSGKYSAKILSNDEYRMVTPLMPCRTSVYMTSSGKVYIARLNAQAMAPMFDPGLAEIMLKSSAEVETIIDKTLKRLSK